MRIFVQAKPAAKVEAVNKRDETHYQVAVKEPPIQGRANAAIVKALAVYFHIAPSGVKIIAGHFSREKIIEISD